HLAAAANAARRACSQGGWCPSRGKDRGRSVTAGPGPGGRSERRSERARRAAGVPAEARTEDARSRRARDLAAAANAAASVLAGRLVSQPRQGPRPDVL